jgi:response regulator NasT
MNAQPRESPGRRGNVLLVDDDTVILFTLGDALRRAGFELLEASSAEDALVLLNEKRPDLALLDVRMPGMSGIDLARHLAEKGEVPFMFLSAFDDPDIVQLAAQNGALGYLVKPVLPQQVIPAIEAGLARASEIRSLRETGARLRQLVHAGHNASMAAGVLMERHRLNRQQAFQALRDYARDHREKLDEVAARYLDAAELLNAGPKKRPATDA